MAPSSSGHRFPATAPAGLTSIEVVTLTEMCKLVWRLRIRILAWTAALSLLLLITVFLVFLRAPAQEMTQLRFRLQFQGSEQGQYPNGLRFSPNDMLKDEVLDRVYGQSAVSRHMDRLAFGAALTITRAADGAFSLDREYALLLSSGSGHTVGQRERFRDEHESARSKMFAQSDYLLHFAGPLAAQVPRDIRTEVLQAVLAEWADFTHTWRGAHLYQVAMLDSEVFDDLDNPDEEPIILLDQMRHQIRRMQRIASQVAALPGVLVSQAPDAPSIEAIRIRLSNLEQYQIQPLGGLIRRGRLYRDLLVARTYIEQILYALELEQERQKGKVNLVRNTLDSYLEDTVLSLPEAPGDPGFSGPLGGSLIPQIGDSFLDRLVEMTKESQDTHYRQDLSRRILSEGGVLLEIERDIAFYRDLLPEVDGNEGMEVPPEELKHLTAYFEEQFHTAIGQAKQLNESLHTVYQFISNHNLFADRDFYQVQSSPEHILATPFSPKKAIFFAAIAAFLLFWLVCFLVLIRHIPGLGLTTLYKNA